MGEHFDETVMTPRLASIDEAIEAGREKAAHTFLTEIRAALEAFAATLPADQQARVTTPLPGGSVLLVEEFRYLGPGILVVHGVHADNQRPAQLVLAPELLQLAFESEARSGDRPGRSIGFKVLDREAPSGPGR